MRICPATGQVCIDDLCYGGGCLKGDGEPLLGVCDECGGIVDETATLSVHGGYCGCDDDWWPDDEAWNKNH